jgi:putative hydrolase of the HAD superfamily
MIFFDIDGTLIDHASASAAASLSFYDHFAGQIPYARKDFPLNWEQILNKHFDRFCRGELSVWGQRRERMREVFADSALSKHECDSRYRVFMSAYEPRIQAFEDALPCLEQLRHERLGIISNGVRDQQIEKLQRTGLLPYFSVLVFSEDTGAGKPAAQIFLEACRRAGARPETCMHIGDNIEADVLPSRALGMKGVRLDRKKSSAAPPPTITDLRELLPLPGEQAIKTAAPPFDKHRAGTFAVFEGWETQNDLKEPYRCPAKS